MMNKLALLVSGGQLTEWLLIAVLVLYFVYKEWPEFRQRITKGAVKEAGEEIQSSRICEQLNAIEQRIGLMDDKLQRDYSRLNELEQEIRKSRRTDRDDLEEREIIMRSLLGIIEGLQEIGANGPTKAAQKEIMEYLNRKTHAADCE